MDDKYVENLLRLIGATSYTQLVHSVARDMFDNPFHKLGVEERSAVFATVNNQIGANMNFLTPDLLRQTVDPKAPNTMSGFPGQAPVAPSKP